MLKLLLLALAVLEILPANNKPSKFNFDFHQNDYELKMERAETVSFQKAYVGSFRMVTFKHNRTTVALNSSITFLVNMENKMEVVVQLYKFASNEYRLFPARFQCNFCDILTIDTFGITAMTKCGNFRRCPLKKGVHYDICNFTPNQANFPPFFPSGSYMAEIEFLYVTTQIAKFRTYIEISRPFIGK